MMVNHEILMVSKEAKKAYTEEEVVKIFNESNDLEEIKKAVESADDRLYTSWATVDAIDKEGQKVPIDEAIKQKEILMKRGSPIQDTHSNKNVGKTLAYRVLRHPKTQTMGILDLNKIYKDNVLDDKIWDETVKGKRKGSSVGGFSTDNEFVSEGMSMFESLKGFNWLETSSVLSPCNSYATNHSVSLIAKQDKMVEENKTQEVKKQEEDMSTETPEVSMEDRVSKIEEALAAVMSKMDEIVEATGGTPEKEESQEAEETEKEDDSDKKESKDKAEEEEEKEDEVKKSLDAIKSELSDVKKQLEKTKVVDVAKSEMPETKVETKTEKVNFSEVMKGKATMSQFLGEEQ